MKEKINYKKFVEDWAEMYYGCSCCKNSRKCKEDCDFALDFEKLINDVNESPHVDEDQQLNLQDYFV